MGKSIYSKGAIEEISTRMNDLQADQIPLWGLMNPTEMLVHCNLANAAILASPIATQSPSLKQRLFKFIFFHIKKDFPKGARAAKRFDVKEKVDEKTFEEEKNKIPGSSYKIWAFGS